MENQSAEFYVTCDGPEYVWQGKKYSVIRNGEMRINYMGEIIEYTPDLVAAGIKSDAQLEVLYNVDAIGNNPWFEIVENEAEWEWDPENVYDRLSDAVEIAKSWEDDE